jgi:hypothetical protein
MITESEENIENSAQAVKENAGLSGEKAEKGNYKLSSLVVEIAQAAWEQFQEWKTINTVLARNEESRRRNPPGLGIQLALPGIPAGRQERFRLRFNFRLKGFYFRR